MRRLEPKSLYLNIFEKIKNKKNKLTLRKTKRKGQLNY